MQKSAKDLIYSQPQNKLADFQFDHNVAEVFPDMIQRSVPGYSTIVDSIGQLTSQYSQDNSNIYDLGCSLGAASMAVRHYPQAKGCHIVAIDNSEAMVERAKLHMSAFRSDTTFDVVCKDILDAPIEKASVVIMNFTLQFIEPENREALLNKIYQGLNPGGALILSEKLRHPTQTGDELLVELHHEFKRRNGYSELEISQKRSALENVMKIDRFDDHAERLKHIGFDDVVLWFKCFNFASMIALKK